MEIKVDHMFRKMYAPGDKTKVYEKHISSYFQVESMTHVVFLLFQKCIFAVKMEQMKPYPYSPPYFMQTDMWS